MPRKKSLHPAYLSCVLYGCSLIWRIPHWHSSSIVYVENDFEIRNIEKISRGHLTQHTISITRSPHIWRNHDPFLILTGFDVDRLRKYGIKVSWPTTLSEISVTLEKKTRRKRKQQQKKKHSIKLRLFFIVHREAFAYTVAFLLQHT